jgi:hypothetical protein
VDVIAINKQFEPKFLSMGEERFYRFVLGLALRQLVSLEAGGEETMPNIELLELHNQFVVLHRREGSEVSLTIAKVFRRAAHKIYRVMLKKGMIEQSPRFLNAV